MAADILRFNRAALAVQDGAREATLGEYVASARYSAEFTNHYIAPMAGALWSQPRDRVLDMPLAFLVRFLEHHGMLSVNGRPEWRVIRGGSHRYVEALIRPLQGRLRLGHPVRAVTRHEDRVEVDGASFDEVVIACHADQALAMLTDATPAERDVLGAFPYQANDVVLHTDHALLPQRRKLWAAWNYHLGTDPAAPVAVTYNMNILQTLAAPVTFCVTLNRTEDVAPARVLRRLTYHHPVFTRAGFAAQQRHAEISGVNRTSFCGAYWGYGFHEDGVRSAMAACRRLAPGAA
jgi:predicted NAD/FAD-binding protein